MTVPDGHLSTRDAIIAYGIGRTLFFSLMRDAGIQPHVEPNEKGGVGYYWPMKKVLAVRARRAGCRDPQPSVAQRAGVEAARLRRIAANIAARELTNAASPITVPAQ